MKLTPIYERFMEKNKCISNSVMLDNRLMYLNQDFQIDVINISTTYTKFTL